VLTPRGPVETTARLWCCGTRCRTGRCRVGASASPLRALQAPPNADGPSMSVYIEKINGPMLFEHKATPAEYKAGLDLAIERGWLACTRAARSFASPRPARTCSPRNHIKRLGNPRGPAPARLKWAPGSEFARRAWGFCGRGGEAQEVKITTIANAAKTSDAYPASAIQSVLQFMTEGSKRPSREPLDPYQAPAVCRSQLPLSRRCWGGRA
jgi:hypothetical protein